MKTTRYLVSGAPLAILLASSVMMFGGCAVDSVDSMPVESENVDETGMSWEAFLELAYQEPDTGMYIVNGDTPVLGIRELEQFYVDYVQQGDLAINTSGGVDTKWNDTQKMNLTYCVSDSFGANKSAVVSAMSSATSTWEYAAGYQVDFIYSSSQDSNCTASNNNVVFDVRPVSGQPYLARAFFPNYPRSSRNILIDSSSFGSISPYTLTGILRHELGHTLGFRHEHTRPEAGVCFEDSNYRPLTPYDSASVMHYPQCNGSNTGDLYLTAKDRDGVNMVYNTGCSHSECISGPKLSGACGPAISSICSVDPYCCNNYWDSICINEVYSVAGSMSCITGSCAHPACETGEKLSSGCDPYGVVSSICAVDPYCCNNYWDSICVGEVSSVAGKTCS